MTAEERSRAREMLDLEEGRGSVPLVGDDGIEAILRTSRRIAVVGASSKLSRPSFGVFRYLVHHGFDCVPVNPLERDVLGIPAFRTLAEAAAATGPFDIVDVFRRPELCVPHAREAVDIGLLQPRVTERAPEGLGLEHRAGEVRGYRTIGESDSHDTHVAMHGAAT